MNQSLTTAILLGCAAMASAACTSLPEDADVALPGPGVPDSFGDDPSTPPAPVAAPHDVDGQPTVGDFAPLATVGSYQLQSTLDVEAATLLPSTADDAVTTLEGLRDHPSQTLFALAEAAGVPAVGTLRDALPSSLESRLDGWIDDHVRGVTTGDGTLAQVIDTVVGICRADVAEVRLGSQLSIDGTGSRHRLDTVELEVMDRALAYDVAALAAIGAELDVAVTARIARDGSDATLAVDGHRFGLPYGAIAWRAANDLVTERYGRDLRAVLGAQIDCAGLAASVADRCVLSVCVGHDSDLRSICEAGLDRAVTELRARALAATVEPIALDGGTARLVDGVPADGAASAIEDGAWTARLDLGQGLRPVAATFSGARR